MITSGPSDGSVCEIRKRNSQAPSGTPIAPPSSASSAPPETSAKRDLAAAWRRPRRAPGDVALALGDRQQQRREQVRRARPPATAPRRRRRPAVASQSRCWSDSIGRQASSSPGVALASERSTSRASAPGFRRTAHSGRRSVAWDGPRQARHREDALEASVVGLDVAADRRHRHRPARDGQRDRPADPHAEVLERGAAERRLARRVGAVARADRERELPQRALEHAQLQPNTPAPHGLRLIHARDGRHVGALAQQRIDPLRRQRARRDADVPRLRAQGGVRADAVCRRLEAHPADQHGGGEREAAERQAGAAPVRKRVLGAEADHDRKAQRARPAREPRSTAGASAAPQRERLGRRDASRPARGDGGREDDDRERQRQREQPPARARNPGRGHGERAARCRRRGRAQSARRPAAPGARRSGPGPRSGRSSAPSPAAG